MKTATFTNFFRISFLGTLLTLLSFSIGCSGSGNLDVSELTDTNIEKLYAAISTYMNINQYKGPKDEAELKGFFQSNPRAQTILGRCGVSLDELDAIFVSERDGEPFTVRYGINGMADHALVFEKVGVDGKRQIALGKVIEADEQMYEDYLSGKIKPNTPASLKDSETTQ